MFVKERFELSESTVEHIQSMRPNFGFNGFGEFIFYRTYSRIVCERCRKPLLYSKITKRDYCERCGDDFEYGQENWNDCVLRVMAGVMSIRKDWYIRNYINWNEDFWQHYAKHMAIAMFDMKWLPPGRGLWCMGTQFVYERGSMALQNCGLTVISDEIGKDINWLMDALMCVPSDTWTLTSEGPRQVSELINKSCTLVINGKNHETKGFTYSGEKEVFEIVTEQGHRVRATANHKFLAERMDIDCWDEVRNLRVGQNLFLNNHEDIEWEGEGNYCEGYLLGWLYGDGTFHRQKCGFEDVKLYFYPDDFEMLNFVTGLFDKYPNTKHNEKNGVRTEHYVIYSKELNEICEKFDVGPDKIINERIEKASSEFLKGFVSAFFDTDGGVTHIDAAAMLSQSNLGRIQAIQRILLRFGINSTLKSSRKAKKNVNIVGRTCNIKEKFTLRIGKENILRFCERIGFKNSRKKENLESKIDNSNRRLGESFKTVIKSITPIGKQKVYDIHVPIIHRFDANGFVAHNCGTGVGFIPTRNDELELFVPQGSYEYIIPDSREGWCDATEALINSFLQKGLPKPKMNYNEIRGPGIPIRGFGGTSSGPAPLIHFHNRIEQFMEMYMTLPWYNSILLKTDIANEAGCCVVAGNTRRSAELLAGDIDDIVDLKNHDKYPYRESHSWMSNNSVFLRTDEDFERLGEIAQRIIKNGEPGYINLKNLPYGRIGKKMGKLRYDEAIGFNPLILAA